MYFCSKLAQIKKKAHLRTADNCRESKKCKSNVVYRLKFENNFQEKKNIQTQMKYKYLFYSTEKYSDFISIAVRSLRKCIQILYEKKKRENSINSQKRKNENSLLIKMY